MKRRTEVYRCVRTSTCVKLSSSKRPQLSPWRTGLFHGEWGGHPHRVVCVHQQMEGWQRNRMGNGKTPNDHPSHCLTMLLKCRHGYHSLYPLTYRIRTCPETGPARIRAFPVCKAARHNEWKQNGPCGVADHRCGGHEAQPTTDCVLGESWPNTLSGEGPRCGHWGSFGKQPPSVDPWPTLFHVKQEHLRTPWDPPSFWRPSARAWG